MGNTTLDFSNKNMVYRKKNFIEKVFFAVDYAKIIELHIVQT